MDREPEQVEFKTVSSEWIFVIFCKHEWQSGKTWLAFSELQGSTRRCWYYSVGAGIFKS